jgi:acetylornithine deacetylase
MSLSLLGAGMTDHTASTEETDRAELLELTRNLVSIPSHDEETHAGDYIERWLSEHTDARVARDDAGNVIARRTLDDVGGIDRDPRSLALVGHHDVVPPDDAQVTDDGGDGDRRDPHSEYVVEERDGRLYGRAVRT